jgi:hypothetical protein
METLKVGDRIYQENYNRITKVYTVERITKTLAICDGGGRFKIEYSSPQWINPVGDTGKWNSNSYLMETPELIDKLYKQVAIQKIRNYDLSVLSSEQMRSIIKILNIH